MHVLLFVCFTWALGATITGYQEEGGVVVGDHDASAFSSRDPGVEAQNHQWFVIPDEQTGVNNPTNARNPPNAWIQALTPTGQDLDGSRGAALTGPSIEYPMYIQTTGQYQLFVRWNVPTMLVTILPSFLFRH